MNSAPLLLFDPRRSAGDRLFRSLSEHLDDVPERFRSDPSLDDQADQRARSLAIGLFARELIRTSLGVANLRELPWQPKESGFTWQWLDDIAGAVNCQEIASAAEVWLRQQSGERFVNPFSTLQQLLMPNRQRRRHGVFYTPDWLARHVSTILEDRCGRWIDPSAGAGVFLTASVLTAYQQGRSFPALTSVDRDPWSLLTVPASLAAVCQVLAIDVERISLEMFAGDLLEGKGNLPSEPFDVVLGNPPWVLWDRLDADCRARTARLWKDFGLHTESGMASILGGGKRDLSFLMTLLVADRWLKVGGMMSMVVPMSMFSSTTSGRGLRRWRLPSGCPLSIRRVDNLSGFQAFAGVRAPAGVVTLVKGEETTYPVDWHVWSSAHGPVEHRQAGPSEADDPLSPWTIHTADGGVLTDRMLGVNEFVAHLGVNSGGANGIYWFDKLSEVGGGLWRMTNKADRGRLDVRQGIVDIEPEFLYPILLGNDLGRWRAEPSAWILLVQDPERRRGIDAIELAKRAPRTFSYLQSHEESLRQRRAFQRYFQRENSAGQRVETGPFYSMFNVGVYTLSPWKVAWNRMGRTLSAALLGQWERRLVLPQETHAFFPVSSEEEGDCLAALLNSGWVRNWLESLNPVSSKSFATPRTMNRLRLRRFDPTRAEDQRLAAFGKMARSVGRPLDDGEERELDQLSVAYWSSDAKPSIDAGATRLS